MSAGRGGWLMRVLSNSNGILTSPAKRARSDEEPTNRSRSVLASDLAFDLDPMCQPLRCGGPHVGHPCAADMH